jgi:hypothetical protein
MPHNAPFQSRHWSPQTAHQIFWERNNCPFVYEYDATDDGPEVEIGRAVLANHTPFELLVESIDFPSAYSEAAL